jgi:putative ABC transport system permease protein
MSDYCLKLPLYDRGCVLAIKTALGDICGGNFDPRELLQANKKRILIEAPGFNPGSIPCIGEDGSAVKVDLNVLLFTFGVSLLTGILFGLVPAISSSRKSLAAVLNESSSRAGVGFRSGKVRSLLVVSEIALALVLVIGAALLIRTFMKLQSVDPGFDTHTVLTMAMSISGDRFLKTSGVAQVIRDGTERINAVPGVTASAAACLPLQGGFGLPFNILGRANGNNPNTGGAGYFPVSWSYFDVFKVPVVRGRNFTEHDNDRRQVWS